MRSWMNGDLSEKMEIVRSFHFRDFAKKFKNRRIIEKFIRRIYTEKLSDGKPGIFTNFENGFAVALFDTSNSANVILVKTDNSEEIYKYSDASDARIAILSLDKKGKASFSKGVKIDESYNDFELQEAYERGFQNGFSMALVEKDSDTSATNLIRFYQAMEALQAYCAAFLVFRDEPDVYKFLHKVYKDFLAEWSNKTLRQILTDLDNKTYHSDNLYDVPNNERKAYSVACFDLFGDVITNQHGSNNSDDWTDRTVGDYRKLSNEAKALARKLGLSHKEIAEFYKDIKTLVGGNGPLTRNRIF